MRRFASSVFTVVILVSVAACGGAATTSPAANPSAPAASSGGGGSPAAGGGAACAVAPAGSTGAATVSIKDFKFNPGSVNAKVGDVVAWKNDDSATHTATMDDGSCDTGSIDSGATAMLVFTTAGTYTYHCNIHPTQMKDVTVVVQ
jgi:plastocyanin